MYRFILFFIAWTLVRLPVQLGKAGTSTIMTCIGHGMVLLTPSRADPRDSTRTRFIAQSLSLTI